MADTKGGILHLPVSGGAYALSSPDGGVLVQSKKASLRLLEHEAQDPTVESLWRCHFDGSANGAFEVSRLDPDEADPAFIALSFGTDGGLLVTMHVYSVAMPSQEKLELAARQRLGFVLSGISQDMIIYDDM